MFVCPYCGNSIGSLGPAPQVGLWSEKERGEKNLTSEASRAAFRSITQLPSVAPGADYMMNFSPGAKRKFA